MEKISIIICVYDEWRFLETAIESCFRQNIFKEIIIVDDCSKVPAPKDLLPILNQKSIKFIKTSENMGLAGATNFGVAQSSGEFFIRLDSDDYFYRNTLTNLCRGLEDKSADIIYGDIISNDLLGCPCKNVTRDGLAVGNPIFAGSLVRKATWEKAGGYPVHPGIKSHYDDWGFWCRCYNVGAKFKYLPGVVYCHREREDSMLRVLAEDPGKYIKLATGELK
jgi:glycosyltransferase involved in cell wall biosynthesis